MKKEKNKKEEVGNHEDHETNKKISFAIHEKVKKLGHDYVLEKLKKYGFSGAEELAKKILADKK